jgi:hypothetical protein
MSDTTEPVESQPTEPLNLDHFLSIQDKMDEIKRKLYALSRDISLQKEILTRSDENCHNENEPSDKLN